MSAAAVALDRPASGRAIASLVLSIVALATGFIILSPVAWYLAHAELDAIRTDWAPRSGHDMCQVARILGVIGTIPFILALLGLLLVPFFLLMALVL